MEKDKNSNPDETNQNPTHNNTNIPKVPNEMKSQIAKKASNSKNLHRIIEAKDLKFDRTKKQEIKTKLCDFCNREIEDISFEPHKRSHPSKIFDWLYLGSYNNATNRKELNYANVKYILNCAQECRNLFKDGFTYKHFQLSVIFFKYYILYLIFYRTYPVLKLLITLKTPSTS